MDSYLEDEVSAQRLMDLEIPDDFAERFGRKDAHHGDTHSADGKPLEGIWDKPRVVRCAWSPPALLGGEMVEELQIFYSDGEVVRVPAEQLRRQ